jgi:lipid-binding SYLF domain-containing protein
MKVGLHHHILSPTPTGDSTRAFIPPANVFIHFSSDLALPGRVAVSPNHMKKFLTAVLSLAVLTVALPAAADGFTRANVITQLDSCEAILQEFQGNFKTAIPADVLRRAKGIVIVNQFQGGFIFGIKDGYGVAMVRRPNGKWSVPAFLRAGEFSFGLQAGAKAVNVVYLLMDDNAARLLFRNRMNLGIDAKAVAGIRDAEREAVSRALPADANVYVYTNNEGLYLGATIKTGYLSPHQRANELFYNAKHRMPELLYSDWVTPPPEARFLMDYVTQLTN